MWEIINFCLLLILIFIVLFLICFFILYYYKIKSYIDDTISNIGSYFPSFDPHEFTDININYPLPSQYDDLLNGLDDNYNNDLAIFLCNVNMSSYNEYSGFDSRIKGISLDDTIGDIGYIYKHKNLDFIIFSFRGTKTNDDIITDLDSMQCEMSEFKNVMVHRGFYRAWCSYKELIKNYLKNNITTSTKIFITGHSLGCAAAIFTALTIPLKYSSNMLYLYMFAPPRIGNHNFIKKLNEMVPNNYAITNIPDLIPNLPPVTFTTIGNTWLYDNFKNRIDMDYQLGSISLNHRLDTYMCGLLENMDNFKERCKDSIWKRETIINIK